MSDTKVDPWALLREARECVVGRCDTGLRDRIDAALAAHEAEAHDSATPVVDWETDAFGTDYVKQGNVLAMVAQTLDGNFGWETRVEGYTDTEDEAKSAAIAAARGMR